MPFEALPTPVTVSPVPESLLVMAVTATVTGVPAVVEVVSGRAVGETTIVTVAGCDVRPEPSVTV